MIMLSSRSAVREALDHYQLRPSKRSGMPMRESTSARITQFMPDEAADVFAQGLSGNDLMVALDYALRDAPRTSRSLGLAFLAGFARYYGLLDEETHRYWTREARQRYRPAKTTAEKVLDPESLRKYFRLFLQKNPSGDFRTARLYLYSSMLLLTGARTQSIWPLTLDKVKLTSTELNLSMPRLKSVTMGDQLVSIPLHTILPSGETFEAVFYRYWDLRPPSKHLFVNELGEQTKGLWMSVNKQMLAHGQQAGVSRVSPHVFRATCACLISDYVGIHQAKQLLGHQHLSTTQKYAGVQYSNTSAKSILGGFAQFAQEGLTQ